MAYDPAIADEVPMLEDALAAWTAPACTRLCFNAAQPLAPSGPVHRTLILSWDHGVLRPGDSDVQTTFTVLPGTVHTLDLINIRRRQGTRATPEGYLTAVGFALGFDRTPGVASVLNGPLVALTSADRQSVCAFYPCASK